MSESGFIYAIGFSDHRLVKIGKTTGPVFKRLTQLQVGQPEPLALLASSAVEKNISRIEKTLHRLLAADRHRGEWFAIAMNQAALDALIEQAVQIIKDEDAQVLSQKEREARREDAIFSGWYYQDWSFGKRVCHCRTKFTWSQEELAVRAGVALDVLMAIETDCERNPPLAIAVALTKALGQSMDVMAGLWVDVLHRGLAMRIDGRLASEFLWRACDSEERVSSPHP